METKLITPSMVTSNTTKKSSNRKQMMKKAVIIIRKLKSQKSASGSGPSLRLRASHLVPEGVTPQL